MFLFDHSLQITQPNLTSMLSFRVFAKFHPRRPLVARRFTLPVRILADRFPRTIEAPVMERISRQPRASRGVGLVLLPALSLPRCVLPSLRCFIFPQVLYLQHLWDPLVCVTNKRLTRSLNPLDATFTRNRGWGRVIGRRFSRADANAKRKKEKEQKERADRSPPLQRGKRWLTLTTTRP